MKTISTMTVIINDEGYNEFIKDASIEILKFLVSAVRTSKKIINKERFHLFSWKDINEESFTRFIPTIESKLKPDQWSLEYTQNSALSLWFAQD